MSTPIDFYFDFGSPYGYLASCRIEKLAAQHDRRVEWHPILLGAIFPLSEQQPLVSVPLKGDYALHDIARSAREYGIDYRQPTTFPLGSVAGSRTVYWLKEHPQEALRERCTSFIHALYRAYFVDDRRIDEPEVVLATADELGIDRSALQSALATPQLKQRLRDAVDAAIELKIFGSPTMRVDGEPFWGNDRLDQLDRWLSRGGW